MTSTLVGMLAQITKSFATCCQCMILILQLLYRSRCLSGTLLRMLLGLSVMRHVTLSLHEGRPC